MDYAIMKTGGKQYRVREGDTLDVEKLTGDTGDKIIFDQILMTSIKGKIDIGKPIVNGAIVNATIQNQTKADKKISLRYKNKTRHRVKTGHRQKITNLFIDSISLKKTKGKLNGS